MSQPDRLQALYQEVLTRRRVGDRGGCVTPERLLDLVERRGDESERLRTLDHVMACPACKAEFDLLRSVTTADRRRFPLPLSIAAALALVVSGTLLWKALAGRGDVFRGDDADVRLISPSPAAQVTLPVRLVWRAVPDAAAYRWEVLDGAGRVVAASASTDTVAVVEPSAQWVAGAEYQWWVRAAMRDGAERRSDILRFRLREP